MGDVLFAACGAAVVVAIVMFIDALRGRGPLAIRPRRRPVDPPHHAARKRREDYTLTR